MFEKKAFNIGRK